MEATKNAQTLIEKASKVAQDLCCEYVMPEHMLFALFDDSKFRFAVDMSTDAYSLEIYNEIEHQILDYVSDDIPFDYEPNLSMQFLTLIESAKFYAQCGGKTEYDVPHLIRGMFDLEESMAAFILQKHFGDNFATFLSTVIQFFDKKEDKEENHDMVDSPTQDPHDETPHIPTDEELDDDEDDNGIDEFDIFNLDSEEGEEQGKKPWEKLVTCMNDMVESHNPLIGREAELERTIQVLCRKDKNNPLHVGEPGVGKTALVYGLVSRIVKGDVPPRLQGCLVYQMDMGAMVAGTQYRGDFEKRIKKVMEGVKKKGNAIVYIDEIHNMIGAGSSSDSSLDASNMLKPYLERGEIRFIGSTTYEEYNRYFAKRRGIVRRFQQIDIPEPSVEEAIGILKGLKKKYEEYHHVTYSNEVIEYAVKASAKHISDRFLPDKAIDLIDEAGAYRELHPIEGKKTQKVDKALVSEVLAKVCKVDAAAMKEESNVSLKALQPNMLAKIYGQDEAVQQVVEAVQMAKAGLTDDDKPLASLLFVGPTGVGKTEVARTLAQELGISLVRFDMSEYTEKHAVAKLIGAPAGYVGYDDGGLLTDAIRKTPNCVLLLDEIEKAHEDIYNILLQVMDYARLTDNRGQKADFRNVILIMTSNAGAQYASQANVGFTSKVSRGEAMLSQVKKTFKPEFINRLSGTVVFHDMNREMASLILDKKLRELQAKLTLKKVNMQLSDDARQLLLEKGFTKEYGAREMDRVIAQMVKPLLMREILFGKLKKGGNAYIVKAEEDGKLKIDN